MVRGYQIARMRLILGAKLISVIAERKRRSKGFSNVMDEYLGLRFSDKTI